MVEEAAIDPNRNLTNEPEAAVDASEAKSLKEIADIDKELGESYEQLRKLREAGFGPSAELGGSGGAMLKAIAAAIFGNGNVVGLINP